MAFVVSTLTEYLNVFKKEVEDENIVFKLFTRASFALCLLSAVMVGTTEFFGAPIICGTTGIRQELFDAFCWINGATHFDFEGKKGKVADFKNKMSCRVQNSVIIWGFFYQT